MSLPALLRALAAALLLAATLPTPTQAQCTDNRVFTLQLERTRYRLPERDYDRLGLMQARWGNAVQRRFPGSTAAAYRQSMIAEAGRYRDGYAARQRERRAWSAVIRWLRAGHGLEHGATFQLNLTGERTCGQWAPHDVH